MEPLPCSSEWFALADQIHGDIYLALDFIPIAVNNRRVLSSDFSLRDKTVWLQDTMEDVFNKVSIE